VGLKAREFASDRRAGCALWFGTAFAIFLIFFGLALLEALRVRDWRAAALWLGAALTFLAADNLRRGVNAAGSAKR